MSLNDWASFVNEVKSALARATSLTVAAHVSPDPDAIGSSFSLALLGRSQGIPTKVFLPDGLPSKFIPLVKDVEWTKDRAWYASEGGTYPILFVVDTATKKRVGEQLFHDFELFSSTINLDHHVSNDSWAEHNYIKGDAAASAQLVTELYQELQIPLTPDVANLLYAGLADDTGNFCFSNTNAKALQTAAMLVALGAEPEAVANTIYFSVPERNLRLQARALDSLELWCQGEASLITVQSGLLNELGCSAEDTEGLVDLARRVEGVQIAAFLRETDGRWKLSLRAKSPQFDVNKIAALFGGGGHAAAAGATLDGSLTEVKAQVQKAVQAVLSARQ